MKVHYIEIDDTLTIFGVVSKKRTNFDNNNVVCVRAYDVSEYNRLYSKDIPKNGIMSIDDARTVWNKRIKSANKITISESVYNTVSGKEVMMDGQVVKAMEEIATRKLNELRN